MTFRVVKSDERGWCNLSNIETWQSSPKTTEDIKTFYNGFPGLSGTSRIL